MYKHGERGYMASLVESSSLRPFPGRGNEGYSTGLHLQFGRENGELENPHPYLE
jgi:NADH:ubiquinone oxidoreductase subunit F (NADH-binding)